MNIKGQFISFPQDNKHLSTCNCLQSGVLNMYIYALNEVEHNIIELIHRPETTYVMYFQKEIGSNRCDIFLNKNLGQKIDNVILRSLKIITP